MGSEFEQVTEVAGYRLGQRIGSGGMGEVFKGFNTSLNRYAAVKILFHESFADRFKNEAYIQASVTHPGIARLYEYTLVSNRHCIVMEYVEGESLDEILQHRGKLSNEEVENIIRQIVAALTYLHSKGIMHRDIKPQNFKVQSNGIVKMLDFGIAKNKYSPKLTQAGFVVGTMEYLAPEQFNQQPEIKSDVWALAVMTYEMVTGYMPFESASPVTLQHLITKGTYTNPSILVPEISETLAALIDRSLKVNTQARISATGLSHLFQKEATFTSGKLSIFSNLPLKKIILGVGTLLLVLVLVFTFSETKEDNHEPGVENIVEVEQGISKAAGSKSTASKILINTPGISNAEIIFNDGIRKQLPFTVEGNEGEKFQFTIQAEGYKSKAVEVRITPMRSSFEYNLEKINN